MIVSVFNSNKIKLIVYESKQLVRVRKHEVDVCKLQSTLKSHKTKLNLTNKGISDELDVKKTTVDHWFRTDSCFSMPGENVWFDLKQLLQIETDEFDESITEFVIKEGVFEKSSRIYDENGLCPTLTTSMNERILVWNK